MNGRRTKLEEGTKVRVQVPSVDKDVDNVHTSLAGQIRDEWTLSDSKKAATPGRSSKRNRPRHVVSTILDHERVRANNWPRKQQKDATYPRFQPTEGPRAKARPRHPHHRTGDRGARHRPRTTSRGPAEGQCPHIKAKTPLTRGHARPRWDSNRVPALTNTGLPRKHTESGPIRSMYPPVRNGKCAHCAHPNLPFYTPRNATRAPPLRERGFLFAPGPQPDSPPPSCARSRPRGTEHATAGRTTQPSKTSWLQTPPSPISSALGLAST
jgi:hypothetical protein